MKFAYTAMNSDYKQVDGTIIANDRETAKAELHAMGLSVLSIAEDTSEDTKPADGGMQNFWFHVLDVNGKESFGTIDAKERKEAFQRLNKEYKLEVLGLCEESVPVENREEEGGKGLSELAAIMLEETGVEAIRNDRTASTQEDSFVDASSNFEQQRKQILNEVDSIMVRAEEIIQKYSDRITPDELVDIQKTIDTIMRMKLSNNILYIQKLSEQLFENIHAIILKYEGVTAHDEGISDTEAPAALKPKNGIRDQLDELSENETRNKSLKNASTLGQLQSMSKRLNTLLHKGTEAAQQKKLKQIQKRKQQQGEGMVGNEIPKEDLHQLEQDQESFLSAIRKIIPLARDIISTKSISFRKRQIQSLKTIIANWKRSYTKKRTIKVQGTTQQVIDREVDHISGKQTMNILLQEIRLFVGWLLSFYVILFFFAQYSFLKGFDTVLPFLKTLFATPFLIFFAAFLFFLSFILRIWNVLKHKKFLFILTSGASFFLFVLFVINF